MTRVWRVYEVAIKRGAVARGGAAVATMRRRSTPLRVALAVALAVAAGCATASRRPGLPPLTTVPHVDLSRYVGTWYEIASFPQRFERGCVASRAEYTLRPDGAIGVTNICRDRTFDGPERRTEGTARVVDPVTNAKLAVTFFWPFRGDYWIIELDPEYRFAVVGHPSRDYLWILARTPTLDAETYDGIVARAARQGYDTSRLRRMPQPPVR
jgi:apolipoprotein D and lipocalin family protein